MQSKDASSNERAVLLFGRKHQEHFGPLSVRTGRTSRRRNSRASEPELHDRSETFHIHSDDESCTGSSASKNAEPPVESLRVDEVSSGSEQESDYPEVYPIWSRETSVDLSPRSLRSSWSSWSPGSPRSCSSSCAWLYDKDHFSPRSEAQRLSVPNVCRRACFRSAAFPYMFLPFAYSRFDGVTSQAAFEVCRTFVEGESEDQGPSSAKVLGALAVREHHRRAEANEQTTQRVLAKVRDLRLESPLVQELNEVSPRVRHRTELLAQVWAGSPRGRDRRSF